jgi:hypothetical protein
MLKKRRFRDRSPIEKALIIMATLVSLAIVGFAELDIHGRTDRETRGPKIAWRLASLNALGAIVYLRIGRR